MSTTSTHRFRWIISSSFFVYIASSAVGSSSRRTRWLLPLLHEASCRTLLWKKILHFISFNTKIDSHTIHKHTVALKRFSKFNSTLKRREKKLRRKKSRKWKVSRSSYKSILLSVLACALSLLLLSATNRIIYPENTWTIYTHRYCRGRQSTIALTLFYSSLSLFRSSFRLSDFGARRAHTNFRNAFRSDVAVRHKRTRARKRKRKNRN